MSLDWLVLAGAAMTGLLGGAHCAAMCGGIATGLSIEQRGGWWVALQPNLGRVGGYVIAGALAGGIGQVLLGVARAPWLIVASRAAVGIVLVLAALRLLDKSGRFNFLSLPGARAWTWLRPLHQRLLPAYTAPRRIALGVLWGWLPCGLSTQLLFAAWLQASAWHGATTMLAFGMATWVVMVPLTWAGARFGQRLQRGGFRTASALLVLCAGLVTLAGPWLVHVPMVHGALEALGCRSVV